MIRTSRIIDGKAHASALRARLAHDIEHWKAATGRTPGLAAIVVGDDPASAVYVKRKGEAARAVGMASTTYALPEATSNSELFDLIARLNRDEQVHGILVQLPLPPHIERERVLEAIDPRKDVDGFHPINVGKLASGNASIVPCTPRGCMILLHAEIGSLEGLHAVVIGCSNIVGRPMAQLLLQARATVSIAHIHTRNLSDLVAVADIVICAAGAPGLVRGTWLKTGATVIDVGINRIERAIGSGTRIVGDVRFEEALDRVSAITPVPGGVGPMTIACLLENTFRAAERLVERHRDGRGLVTG